MKLSNQILTWIVILGVGVLPSNVLAGDAKHGEEGHVCSEDEKKHVTPSSEPIVVEKDHVVLEVKGFVCTFCAFGAKRFLGKLKFLDKSLPSKERIVTDIDRGRVTLAIDPEKKINPKKIEKAIKKGGYELVAIHEYEGGDA